MMTIGTAWYGFRDFTARNYFAVARALGLTQVEVPLYWQVIEDRHFDLQDRAAVRGLADAIGVEMHAGVAAIDLAGPFNQFGLPVTEEELEFNTSLARRVIDIGADLGLQVIRLTEPNILDEHLSLADQYLENHGQVLNCLGDYAAGLGVAIAVENYGLTSTQMRALLDAVDNPNVGTLFDPCNYFRMGEDPRESLSLLGGSVQYCHVKDSVVDDPRSPGELAPDSRWRPSIEVGAGEIEWELLLRELSTEYAGVLAIECEMAEDVILATMRSRDFLQEILGSL